MARHADYETQLRNFHAQGFAQRTMARLLNLSTSTVAKRLTKLGLDAPVDPPPRVATQRRPHGHPGYLRRCSTTCASWSTGGGTGGQPCSTPRRRAARWSV